MGFDSTNYGQQLAFDVCKRSIEKHNKNVQKKVGTWSIDEYKHLGMLHLYIKIKSFQRFTENFSIFEKADQLTPSLFKNINNDINVASIGGGPGFELVAFDFYFKHNSKHSDKNLNISFYNIDLVNDWNDYYSLNGNKYFFEQGDFFKLNIKKKMDYIIFSNTFGTYLNNEYGWNNIINLLKTAKAIFINDRNKNLNDFKNKILSNNLYFIEILGKNDHRQVIITKDKYIIPLQFNVIFKNVPYIR